MEVLHVVNGQTIYPVGLNIVHNLPVINDMAKNLLKLIVKKFPDHEQTILFCRGSSGAIISGLISNHLIKGGLKVMICHIKKDGEYSHGGTSMSDISEYKSVWVVVDDFIDTGKTIEAIIDVVERKGYYRQFDILCVSGRIPKYFLDLDKFTFGIRSK